MRPSARASTLTLALASIVVAGTACRSSGGPTDADVIAAHKLYARDRCEAMIERNARIDWTAGPTTRKPFFDLMDAHCHEIAGRTARAEGLYEQIVSEAPQTHQAYEAALRLREIRRLAELGLSRDEFAEREKSARPQGEPVPPIERVEPIYPSALRAARVEGWVLIDYGVSPDGTVVDPVVLESHPRFVFDGAALSALRHWVFEPRVQATAARQQVVLDFKLERKRGW